MLDFLSEDVECDKQCMFHIIICLTGTFFSSELFPHELSVAFFQMMFADHMNHFSFSDCHGALPYFLVSNKKKSLKVTGAAHMNMHACEFVYGVF